MSKLLLLTLCCIGSLASTSAALPSVASHLEQIFIGLATGNCDLLAAQYGPNASLLLAMPPMPPIVGRQAIAGSCQSTLEKARILEVGGPVFRYNDTLSANVISELVFDRVSTNVTASLQTAAIIYTDAATGLLQDVTQFVDIDHIAAPAALASLATEAFAAYGHNCTKLGEYFTADASWAQPNRPTAVGRDNIVKGCGYSKYPGWSTILQTFWNPALPDTVVVAIGDMAPGNGTAADPARHAPGVGLFEVDGTSGLITLARIHGGL